MTFSNEEEYAFRLAFLWCQQVCRWLVDSGNLREAIQMADFAIQYGARLCQYMIERNRVLRKQLRT